MEKSQNWYKQFTDKLELSGMSPRTQESYSRAVKLLKDHFNKDLREITEQDVQDYLLYRKNISKWAPSTLKVALCGIRYYFQLIQKVNWEIFKIAKFYSGRQLPSVLTREEVDRLLKCVTPCCGAA